MENETLDLDVMELADIIGSASDQADMAQVMAASCTTTSVSTSSSSSS